MFFDFFFFVFGVMCGGDEVIFVLVFNCVILMMFECLFLLLWILGEVLNFMCVVSGYWYFLIKD